MSLQLNNMRKLSTEYSLTKYNYCNFIRSIRTLDYNTERLSHGM